MTPAELLFQIVRFAGPTRANVSVSYTPDEVPGSRVSGSRVSAVRYGISLKEAWSGNIEDIGAHRDLCFEQTAGLGAAESACANLRRREQAVDLRRTDFQHLCA